MITIIDYGCGNPASIQNMLKKIGETSTISSNPEDIGRADKLILPGVGAFEHGMKQLQALALIPVLNQQVLINKVPILGICLGAQLFFKSSEEGNIHGLSWIDGQVTHFDPTKLSATDKIPHMGWTDIHLTKESLLIDTLDEIPRYYFVHSYHMQCSQSDNILATAHHGYDFTAAIEQDNIMGVQFHPEKSHTFGMNLLKNFATKF